MRVYRKEFERLKKARRIVDSEFEYLGVNKKRELVRLFYEISKKENLSPEKVFQDIDSKDFDGIKDRLLKRRLPCAYLQNEISRPYLPKIKLDNDFIADLEERKFYPKKVYIEKSAWRSGLAERFRKFFPKAKFMEIKSLKDHLRKNRGLDIKDYNNRREAAFITYENYDFFKKCPCTKKAIGCGYHIFNLSFGCLFECSYCYLQEYTNSPGLIFPANIDRFFKDFASYKRSGMRIGTGEFSDSLMLDHITGYSLPIVEFFRNHKETTFEFKTKSVNIANLLKIKHAGNIVVAWSFNPQKIIDENEFFTPNLSERLKAAGRCVEAGYKASCHFDPVIYYEGWQKEYEKVIDMLFDTIRPKDIAWISIGTLRFNPRVKQTIEARFPGNKILDEELVLGYDDKLRYPYAIRLEIYRSILKMLYRHSKKLPIYLCMENSSIWRELSLRPVASLR